MVKELCAADDPTGGHCANGFDTSLTGFTVNFHVFAANGALVETIHVTLSRIGQGSTTGGPLPLGTFIVCEVPVAYGPHGQQVPLVVTPAPEGPNQQVTKTGCIRLALSAGTNRVTFLDVRVQVQPSPSPRPSPSPSPGVTTLPGTGAGQSLLGGSVLWAWVAILGACLLSVAGYGLRRRNHVHSRSGPRRL